MYWCKSNLSKPIQKKCLNFSIAVITLLGVAFSSCKDTVKEESKKEKYKFLFIGSEDAVDKDMLTKFGTFKELSLEDVFGYYLKKAELTSKKQKYC